MTICQIGILVCAHDYILYLWSRILFRVIENVCVTIALMVNLYFDSYGFTIGAFKNAAGIFFEDRWIPAIQSVINIVVSVGLVRVWGLAGVILGTIVSQMILYSFSYPQYVYNRIFGRSMAAYYIESIKYALIFLATFVVTKVIVRMIHVENVFLLLISNIIICALFPNIVLFLLFFRKEEFKYYVVLIKKKLKRK